MTDLALIFFICAVVLLAAVLVSARRLEHRVSALAQPRDGDATGAPTERNAALLEQLETVAEGLPIDRDRLAAAPPAVPGGVLVVGRMYRVANVALRITASLP